MAITFTATRGEANGGTTAATTIGVSPGVTLDVGDEITVVVTANNVGTTDADDTGEIASVADNSTQTGTANTWTKLKERRRSLGAAGDGAVVAIFQSRLTRSILSTDTITVTYANSVAGRTVSLDESASGAALQLATNGAGTASGGTTTPSASTGTMTSKEYLLIGAMAQQGGTNVTVTNDADYGTADHNFSTGGTTAAHMRQYSSHRIATLTTDTYGLTLSAAREWALLLVALEEASGDAVATPATIAAVAAVPSVTAGGGGSTSPSTVAATGAVPAVSAQGAGTVSPAAVAAIGAVPDAVATGTGGGNGTASPVTVAAVATVPAPTVRGGGTVAPAAAAAVAAVPAPVVSGGARATPATAAAVAAIPAPILSGGATASPATVAAIAAVPLVVATGTGGILVFLSEGDAAVASALEGDAAMTRPLEGVGLMAAGLEGG